MSAASAGYVDDAAAALAESNVYVSAEVSGSAALRDALTQQISDASIGVAVFSDNAALEASGPEIVSELADRTGFDTIIVAVGDDLSAGSRVLASGEAMRIANEAEASAGGVDQALVETVQGVVAAADAPAPPAAGVDGGVIVGIALAAAAIAAVIGIAIGVMRSRRARGRADRRLPEGVRSDVALLQTLRGEYAALGASGNPVAAQTANDIGDIAGNVVELFARLDKRSDEGQHSLAAVEYDDKLRKLTAALNRDYLLDILTHPHLWDDPDERIREVRGAVSGVSEELLENIKQVNARRGLHFQVSLDGLIGRRKELQDWEREFDRAAEEGGPTGSVGDLDRG